MSDDSAMAAGEALGRLNGIALFEGLPESDIHAFERQCHWHRYAADAVVFDKETTQLEVYFVVEGAVRVLSYSSYARDGREVTLANFISGDYFGELAAIDNRPRSAKVVASEPTLLASIEGGGFMAFMEKHPHVAIRVLRRFAGIIRTLDIRVTELSTLSDQQRIYTELLHMAKPDPKRGGAWTIPEMPKHKDLSSWTGATTEVVAQTIGELARDGLIERRHMAMVIRDLPRLQLMARASR